MRSLSSSMGSGLAASSDAFLVLLRALQSGGTARRTRCLAPGLRAGLRRLAFLQTVEQPLEQLRIEILVRVLADLHDGSVGAAAEALDLFPREAAVARQLARVLGDLFLADFDQRLGAAQHARRRPAHPQVRRLTDRGELEHRVEGRDL